MKSRAQTQSTTSQVSPQGRERPETGMGNAATQEALDAADSAGLPTLESMGLSDDPASQVGSALGLDGLQVSEDHVSLDGKGLSLDESIDLSLGALGPLTVGLNGALSASLSHGFQGDIEGGWFGGRYAEIKGHAALDVDTSIMAKVALDLLVAEGGLRGGLQLKAGLQGEVTGCLSFAEDGVHLDSLSMHVEGAAELGAAAELYVSTLLTDEQTWELGSLPLGVASGFALDLSWDDSGFSGIDGSLGSGFEMSPELEALIEDLKAKVGM